MQKINIAQELAKQTGLQRSDATKATDAFFNIMAQSFANGDSIFIRGFGTFKIITRAPKKVRNIKAGSSYIVPTHNTVKFIPSNQLTIKQ